MIKLRSAFGLVDCLGPSDDASRQIDDRIVDELAIDLNRGQATTLRLGECFQHTPGVSELPFGRPENVVHSRNLVGMDAQLSLEAKVLGALGRTPEAGKAYKEVIIAFDALSVIVNPANKVKQLTREQIEGIFTGKITNWKDVGGDDAKIIAYSRESSSGTYEFFKDHVLNGKNYGSAILMMPATGAIVQSVSQTKGAIGYIGFAYMEKTVSPLNISYDKGKTFVEPTVANAKNKSYPVVRPLYYYYLTKDGAKVKSFIDYILSEEGQKVVNDVGYITLN